MAFADGTRSKGAPLRVSSNKGTNMPPIGNCFKQISNLLLVWSPSYLNSSFCEPNQKSVKSTMRYRIHAVAPLAAFVFVLSCEIGCHGQVTTVTNATTMPSLGGDNETVGIGNDNETVVTPALPIEPSPPPEDGNAALANATDAPDPDGIDDTSSRVNVTVVPVDGDGATVPPTVSATQTFPPPSNSTPDGGDDTQGDDVPATLTSPPTEITICPDEWRNYKRCFRENLPDEQADGCDFCVGASFPEPGSPCEMFADSICYALTEACDCGTCAGDVKTYLECVFDELQLDCGLDCPINETISNTTVDEDGTTIVDVDTEAPVFPELESSFDKSPGKDAVTADPTTDIDSEVQCQSVEDDYQVCLAERLSETDAGDCETCFVSPT